MKLIQIIAQARQTAKRISDQSSEMAASGSFLSWFGFGSLDPGSPFGGAEAEDSGECLRKTHEFLDRALENLCQIFKVDGFGSGFVVSLSLKGRLWWSGRPLIGRLQVWVPLCPTVLSGAVVGISW